MKKLIIFIVTIAATIVSALFLILIGLQTAVGEKLSNELFYKFPSVINRVFFFPYSFQLFLSIANIISFVTGLFILIQFKRRKTCSNLLLYSLLIILLIVLVLNFLLAYLACYPQIPRDASVPRNFSPTTFWKEDILSYPYFLWLYHRCPLRPGGPG